jgi:hypothetical protein
MSPCLIQQIQRSPHEIGAGGSAGVRRILPGDAGVKIPPGLSNLWGDAIS